MHVSHQWTQILWWTLKILNYVLGEFCGRSWRFKIHFWRNIVHFWKSNICPQMSDVHARNKLLLFTVQQTEIISLDTRLRLDGLFALELRDLIVSVLVNVFRVSDGSGQFDSDVHKRHKSQKEDRCDGRHWFCSFKCPICASRSFIVCVWGQWSSDQDDH